MSILHKNKVARIGPLSKECYQGSLTNPQKRCSHPPAKNTFFVGWWAIPDYYHLRVMITLYGYCFIFLTMKGRFSLRMRSAILLRSIGLTRG